MAHHKKCSLTFGELLLHLINVSLYKIICTSVDNDLPAETLSQPLTCKLYIGNATINRIKILFVCNSIHLSTNM